MNTIGPEELRTLPFLAGENFGAPAIPFSRETLEQCADTHILIFTPQIKWLTLTGLREKFGMDPAVSEPCMYNQDWYLREDFANEPLDGQWHLIPKAVRENARGKQPEDIQKGLQGEQFPNAITLTFTFFTWRLLKGETLWKHDYLWSSDTDHNGDRVYVGGYEDPVGINKNGFNVHRHLSLRAMHTAAPEVIS